LRITRSGTDQDDELKREPLDDTFLPDCGAIELVWDRKAVAIQFAGKHWVVIVGCDVGRQGAFVGEPVDFRVMTETLRVRRRLADGAEVNRA